MLLGIICLLSPDGIPESLLQRSKSSSHPDELKFCSDVMKHEPIRDATWYHANSLKKVLRALRSAGMISLSRSHIRIHRLTQSVFLNHVKIDDERKMFYAASILVNATFPKQHLSNPLFEQWGACSAYLLHA